jgi:hypothetical protein
VATPETQLSQLRVAAVWGTTVLTVRELRRGESFDVSDGPKHSIPMPDGMDIAPAPLRAVPGGWELDPRGIAAGLLLLRGRQEDPIAIARSGVPVAVMPGDYGLLQYGLLSIFFQYFQVPTRRVPPRGFEAVTILSLLASVVLHGGAVGVFKTLMPKPPPAAPMELSSPGEFAARLGVQHGFGQGEAPGANTPVVRLLPRSSMAELLEASRATTLQERINGVRAVPSALLGLGATTLVPGAEGGSKPEPAGGPAPSNTMQTGWHGSPAGSSSAALDAGAPADPKAAKGALSSDQVRRVVVSHQATVRACYDAELPKHPGLKGNVTVTWQIEPNGSVSSAEVASSTLSNARAEACIVKQVKLWKFPTAELPTQPTFPFILGSK